MRTLIALPFAGCVAAPTASTPTATSPAECDVPETAATLAGPGAVDCGFVPLGDPLAPAWDCAVTAFQAGDAFSLAWEDQGIDTRLVYALVSNGAQAWRLAQDHEDEPPWRIDGWDCLDPVVAVVEDDPFDGVDESGLTEVVCTAWAPEGNHYEVCGECPGCNPPGVPFVWP